MMEHRPTRMIVYAFAIAVILCSLVPSLMAQNVSATLTGTVMDSTQAVIPNATVVVKNEASGITRRTTSNAEGYFTIAALPPGTYTVTVESPGFSKWESKGVAFNPGDKRNLSDILLKPGAASETIEVVGASEQVTPVDSGEKSAVIGQQQLQNVSVVGRNAAEFIKIMPGMALTGGLVNRPGFTGEEEGTGKGPIGSFSANGQRTGALDITADGAHIIDPGCNCGQAVNTNADMMQEIKVLTSNFGAENQKGPVVVSAVGKSGGSNFHGEGYLYARHNVMNANDWLNNSAGLGSDGKMVAPRPQTKYFYPGGSIGGPILIPGSNFNKNRDKLFFHFAYELYKQTVDNGIYRAFVPTDEMRNGNFQQSYLDSLRGDQYVGYAVQNAPKAEEFPGGIIPKSRIDSRGLALMNLYPKPNVDAKMNRGSNYVRSFTRTQDMYQMRPRVDWSIDDNTKLYVSYNRQRDTGEALDTLWWRPEPTVPYPSAIDQKNESDSISVNMTKVFGPTLTNEAVFTYTRLNLPNTYRDPSKIDRAAIGLNYKTIFNGKNPYIPEITGWSDGIANVINGGGFELTGAMYAKKVMPTIADNVSKVWGTHTAKFGFYWENVSNEQPAGGTTNGVFEFADWNANSTGNAYADMLMARAIHYGETNYNPLDRMHYTVADFYVQDSWKVNRRLTLDGGVRFSHLGPWVDPDGVGFGVWDGSKYSNNPADVKKMTGILYNKIDKSIPLSGAKSRALFINPRVGFAFDIFGTGKTVMRGGFGMYRFHDEQNVVASALDIVRGSYGYTIPNAVMSLDEIGNTQADFVPPGQPTLLDPKDDRQPRTISYSFTISQRMPKQSLFEVAYVGNKSDYLSNWNNNFGKLNNLPIGALLKPEIWQLDVNADNYRPLKNYQNVKIINHEMYSNYNSLQASWNKQSGKLTYLINYTFSKSLGIRGEGGSAVGDPTNLRNSYGVLKNDRTHIFNAAYVYEVPKLGTDNKFLRGVTHGWQISGITQFQSGVNLQAAGNSARFNFSGYFPVGTQLPNGQIVKPGDNISISNTRLLGTPDVDLMPRITCDPRNGLKENQFINGACFAPPTFGANGDFNFPYLRGPSFVNSDLSVFKNFEFSEQKRLQFRVSAFNFLNHPIRSFIDNDPNLNLSFNENGQMTNTRFGIADSKVGHRTLQLAVKYYF